MIRAEIIADSIVKETGARVTTFLLTFPRWILAEMNTHRVFSRNTSSSRAIPVQKIISEVIKNPAMPIRFGLAKKGMQDGGPLTNTANKFAAWVWLLSRWPVILCVLVLLKLKVHKQFANRLLEPWTWCHQVVTSTYWRNFYKLRNHEDAQPEIHELAKQMYELHKQSVPKELRAGEWHLPFSDQHIPDEVSIEDKLKICTARCARTSYNNFYGKNDVNSDIKLCEVLASSGHWSPFEHCCMAMTTAKRSGNFIGFEQYRKQFPLEDGNDSGLYFTPY